MQTPVAPASTTTPAPLSRQLIELIASKPVNDADLAAAALFALDAIANTIAGRNSPPGRKLLAWAADASEGSGLASLDPARQAFIAGALCHILEVDDLHRASVVHPGCVVVPAIMILGRHQPGRAVLKALLAGFEAACRVGMAVGPAHYRTWHNTATCGPFGSAVAAGSLLGLDQLQMQHALGNAGSQSAGLWEFIETGAETKHLHAGRAAEAGIVAAQLAAHDFTGAPAILEGKRGFFAATCPDPNLQALLNAAGSPWQVHNTSIKPWPSCRHTHPAIACALELHSRLIDEKLGLADIKSIEITAYPAAIDLCDRPQPQSVYAAKFSLHHCVAVALHSGRVDFAGFEAGPRDDLSDLRDRTSVAAAEPFVSQYPVHWGSAVRLTMSDGRLLEHSARDAKGDPEAPLSRDELVAKAIDLMKFGSVDNGERIVGAVLAMTKDATTPDMMDWIG